MKELRQGGDIAIDMAFGRTPFYIPSNLLQTMANHIGNIWVMCGFSKFFHSIKRCLSNLNTKGIIVVVSPFSNNIDGVRYRKGNS